MGDLRVRLAILADMHEPPKSRRHWFRFAFSLRTLFVVVTVFGCWLGLNLYQLGQREAMREHIESKGGFISDVADVPRQRPMPLSWRLLGGQRVYSILLPKALADDMQEVERRFPEAEVRIVSPYLLLLVRCPPGSLYPTMISAAEARRAGEKASAAK